MSFTPYPKRVYSSKRGKRAAYIGSVKAVHFRCNKDVMHDKDENYFMPPALLLYVVIKNERGETCL